MDIRNKRKIFYECLNEKFIDLLFYFIIAFIIMIILIMILSIIVGIVLRWI